MLQDVLTVPPDATSTQPVGREISVSAISARGQIQITIVTQYPDYIYLGDLLDISVHHRRVPVKPLSEAYQTMLASEAVLSRNWDTPEEDEAWADL